MRPRMSVVHVIALSLHVHVRQIDGLRKKTIDGREIRVLRRFHAVRKVGSGRGREVDYQKQVCPS